MSSLRDHDDVFKDDTGEFPAELATKRFGMSSTVAATIKRYQEEAGRNGTIAPVELAGLVGLIGRRSDRRLILVDAGKRSAEYVLASRKTVATRAPAVVGGRLGFGAVKKLARKYFGLEISGSPALPEVKGPELAGIGAEVQLGICDVYGSAAGVLLERLVGFQGALDHRSCRGRGDSSCVWTSARGDVASESA